MTYRLAKSLAFAAAALVAGTSTAQAAVYVGSFQVDQGPGWRSNPTVYSATEAAALLFGGAASDYDISTIDTNPANIDNQGWYSIWGVGGGTKFSEDYKLDVGAPGYNAPGGANSAISAYVNDNALGAQFTNYVFRVNGSAVPEPATWLLMIAGAGLIGAALRRPQPIRRATLSFA